MNTQSTQLVSKGLVIGGGGKKGIWTCAVLEERQPSVTYGTGVSTGAAIIPLAVAGRFHDATEAYLSLEDHIYDKDPFTKSGKIRVLNAVNKLGINVKPGLAKATGLEERIRAYYRRDHHEKLKSQGKSFTVGATRIDRLEGGIRYFNSNAWDYEVMVKAIVASCSVPGIFEPVQIGDGWYVDGGVADPIPLKQAIVEHPELQYDVYTHQVRAGMMKTGERRVKSIPDVMGACLEIGMREIAACDLEKLRPQDKLYQIPYQVTENSLVFDNKEMRKIYEQAKGIAKLLKDTRTQ